MTEARAWAAPGSSDLVAHISCGSTLSILGLERGYYKIQLDGIIAYIRSKYIRIQPTEKQRTTQQEEQVKEIQQPVPTPTPAQPTPRLQLSEPPATTYYDEATRFSIGGMFTWSRSFDDDLYRRPFGSRDYLGWDTAFMGCITENFALEFDVSGSYWLTPTKNYHSISGGPRFIFPGRRVSPYVHFLVGLARGSKVPFDLEISPNALMLAPGFGIDVSINKRFAFRTFQVDWIVLHHEEAFDGWSLTNLRIGAGFAVKF